MLKRAANAAAGAAAGPAILAALAVAALWILSRDGVAKAAAKAAVQGAGNLAGGVVAGTAEAVGEAVGVPVTNEDECTRAIREGRAWDASFACPAPRYLRWAMTGEDIGGNA